MSHIQSSSNPMRWAVKWLTLLVWGLAVGGAVIWALKFPRYSGEAAASLAQTTAGQSGAQLSAGVARSLGFRATSPSAEVAADMRFQLLGVIAGGSGRGSALISVGGQPPKAFRVGQTVTEGVVLRRLQDRQAELGTTSSGQAQWILELPTAATGG